MPRMQMTLEDFRKKMTELNSGFDLASYERGDIDTERSVDLNIAESKIAELIKANVKNVDQMKVILDKLSDEDLKIAREELQENILSRFAKMEEMEVKYVLLKSTEEKKLLSHQVKGMRGDRDIMDALMKNTNAELQKKLPKSPHSDLLEAAYNQDYAQKKVLARLDMADKLIKRGMKKERAEYVCFHGGDDIHVNHLTTMIEKDLPAGYKIEYDDSSKAFKECIKNHIEKEYPTKDSYGSSFALPLQPSEEIMRIESEFEIRQSCIEYKKTAIFDTEDTKLEAQKVACSKIEKVLKIHPACKDYNNGHSESVKLREKVAKILLDQSMKDNSSFSDRLSSRIKGAIEDIKNALHLGSTKSREATKVAKNIVAGLKESGSISLPRIAPSSSGKVSAKKEQKAYGRQ